MALPQLTDEQRAAITALHASNKVVAYTYNTSSSAQAAAQAFLKGHGLDLQALDMLERKWKVATSRHWMNNKAKVYRTLYQWYIHQLQSVRYCNINICVHGLVGAEDVSHDDPHSCTRSSAYVLTFMVCIPPS